MKYALIVPFIIPLICIAEPMQVSLSIENISGNTCSLKVGSDSVHLVAKKERVTKSEWGNYAIFPSSNFTQGEREADLFLTNCEVALSNEDVVGQLKYCALASSSETQYSSGKYRVPYSVSNCSSFVRGTRLVFAASIKSDDKKKSLNPMSCSFMCLVE
ncbi:hypothetical protein [Teredinibacter turnerae]|uniref:hypothetical protein n=1 Tax=Teredinibacter turnerae TaxID=2426 RepID=UPI00037BAD70|nr:hypothetical protein [Teredinibacter turnerae]